MKKIIFLILFSAICVTSFAQIVDSKRVGDKFVFIDKNGRQIGNQMYDGAWWDGPYGGVRIGDYQTPVDSKGNYIIPLKYNGYDLDEDTGNFIVYRKENENFFKGMYSTSGKELIPCVYTELSVYERGISVRNAEGYFGVYSYKGELLFPIEYTYRIIFDDVDSSEDYEYSFLSKGGVMNPKTEAIPVESLIGMVDDRSMKVIVPCEYAACDDINKDYIRVNKGGVHGRGSWVENGSWHYDGNFREAKGGKWGVLYKGKEFVPIQYADVRISESSTPIFAIQGEENGKWALWAKGTVISDYQYDFPPEFENDVAQVSINGNYEMLKNPLKDKNAIKLRNDYAKADLKAAAKKNGKAVSRYPVASSDVDSNIPHNSSKNNRFAFIIANENYEFAPVPFSLNDGRTFYQYCYSTLGIPEKHIFMVEDATLGDIITTIERLKNISDSYDGDAELIFYYAGHGVPDENSNSAYLVPIDGDMKNIHKTGYSLASLYNELSKLHTKNVFAFIDACFSGAKRENESLLTNRGIAIDTKTEVPTGRMIAFTASTGSETAHQLEKNNHGLFTYYLLKFIQDNKGIPSMGELTDYVTKNVKRQSVVINNKKQTPTVVPSSSLTDSWRGISF